MRRKPGALLRIIGTLALAGAVSALPSCLSSDTPEPVDGPDPVVEETPQGLTVDESVDLGWPAAPQVERIRYYNSVTATAAWVDAGDLRISAPRSVAFDEAAERLYITTGYGVRVVDTATGTVTEFAPERSIPRGLAVGPNGDVYVADQGTASVAVLGRDGREIREIGAGHLVDPQGIAIDPARSRLYVADAAGNTVSAWSLEGEHLFDFEASVESPLILPLDLAINSAGLVYVVNWGRQRVHIHGPDGAFIRGFAEEGLWSGQLLRPKGIAIDSDDNVYVTDSAFGNVQIWDAEDRLCLWFGEVGSAIGQLNLPAQLAIDSQDRIFVAEYGSHRVQIFQYLSQ